MKCIISPYNIDKLTLFVYVPPRCSMCDCCYKTTFEFLEWTLFFSSLPKNVNVGDNDGKPDEDFFSCKTVRLFVMIFDDLETREKNFLLCHQICFT